MQREIKKKKKKETCTMSISALQYNSKNNILCNQ